MGGSLIHSKTFRITSWRSEEFGSHCEVGPDEGGGYDHFSYTSWAELKKRDRAPGTPRPGPGAGR